jgi:hypothetical protein
VRGPAGYGRYDDDPQHIGCPWAKSDMTPCIARDGNIALTDPGPWAPACVGCGHTVTFLVADLASEHPSARQPIPADPDAAADQFHELVKAATEPGTP